MHIPTSKAMSPLSTRMSSQKFIKRFVKACLVAYELMLTLKKTREPRKRVILVCSTDFAFDFALLCLFQSMAQFPWHDGSIKNVHVDPTLLFVYQVCY